MGMVAMNINAEVAQGFIEAYMKVNHET